MAIRKKIELIASLKAEDYKVGDYAVKSATIKSVQDVKTRFDEEGKPSTTLTFTDSEGKEGSVFVNMRSNNNLIDAWGENDSVWTGKMINVICEKDPTFSKKMLVIEPIA